MNDTNSPSGEAQCADSASQVSQWLYLHTALGKGYVAPMVYTPAWLITSGVPVELTRRMRAAENSFHDVHEKSVAKDKAHLDDLEQTAQATKRMGVAPAIATEIKSLKEKLARPVFVNYRDWNADKATMLELLSKSKFRAMSFVDEMGIRSHNYTVNAFLAARHIASDLSLLSLSGDQSSDSVLIRSSATGGANMLSVRGSDTPRFNLMTLTSPDAAKKIANRLKNAAPCRGVTVILPYQPSTTLAVGDDQIAKVIRKVYATETPDDRITVTMTPAWEDFLSSRAENVAPSGAALEAIHKSLASVQALTHAVARAVVTRKIFECEDGIGLPGDGERVVALDDGDLEIARQWFVDLIPTLGFTHLAARRKNAEVARASWVSGPSVESVIAAKAALISAVQADDHQMVAYHNAARLPGVTARTLDATVESYPNVFKVLHNVRRPGAKRVAARVIVLSEGWKEASVPVGGLGSHEPGSQLDDETVDQLYHEWQRHAETQQRRGYRPSVDVASLTDALKPSLLRVQRRYWQTTTLIPSGTDGAMELWFRKNTAGEDMCNWKESYTKWKVFEKWQDKDAAAQEERDTKNSIQDND